MIKLLKGTPAAYRSRGATVLVHAVRTDRSWVSGMIDRSLCDVRVNVHEEEFEPQSAISCKRCIKAARRYKVVTIVARAANSSESKVAIVDSRTDETVTTVYGKARGQALAEHMERCTATERCPSCPSAVVAARRAELEG